MMLRDDDRYALNKDLVCNQVYLYTDAKMAAKMRVQQLLQQMVKQIKVVERAERIEKKQELLQRGLLLTKTREELFSRDCKKYHAKTGKQVKRMQPNLNDTPVVVGASRIKIDLKAPEPADVQREVQIYKITLENVNNVLVGMRNIGVTTTRPADYMAEMFKSDKQMERIRKGLVERQETIREKMQNKVWEKRKKRHDKRDKRPVTSEKRKKIMKDTKRKQDSKKQSKGPKMEKFKGKRRQKK